MGFEVSEMVVGLNAKLEAFMEEHVYPRRARLARVDIQSGQSLGDTPLV